MLKIVRSYGGCMSSLLYIIQSTNSENLIVCYIHFKLRFVLACVATDQLLVYENLIHCCYEI